jgi:hypothetical protein
MQENDIGPYRIVPSLHDSEVYFLFCPDGEEKKFGLSQKGQIIEYKGDALWGNEKKIIKHHFGL